MIQLSDMLLDKSYPESGALLYEDMRPLLMENKSVDIDLSGVISLPSMFLNASIGRAADEFGVEMVRKNVIFYHVSKSQAERLKEYFERI